MLEEIARTDVTKGVARPNWGYEYKQSKEKDHVQQHRLTFRMAMAPEERRSVNVWPSDEFRCVYLHMDGSMSLKCTQVHPQGSQPRHLTRSPSRMILKVASFVDSVLCELEVHACKLAQVCLAVKDHDSAHVMVNVPGLVVCAEKQPWSSALGRCGQDAT